MNEQHARHVLEEIVKAGVQEFVVSAGSRNAPFVYALAHSISVKTYYCPEERSASFYALGLARASGRPVAVVTSSGTAVGELLPAAMEAYYTHAPLLLVTADRPRRMRGTGAPQCAEQEGIFSYYARYMQDLSQGESCGISKWCQKGPAHLNICFEEPKGANYDAYANDLLAGVKGQPKVRRKEQFSIELFEEFHKQVRYPLVVLGGLSPYEREAAVEFLLRFKAPVYPEAPSGLREDRRLEPCRVSVDQVWQRAEDHGYPIDGILRIGSIPTGRIWRDLDYREGRIAVCSICELPFSGLSWSEGIFAPFDEFYAKAKHLNLDRGYPCQNWTTYERELEKKMTLLFEEEPHAEASMVHHLSKLIPEGALVYLGNSLPIREWDLAAVREKSFEIAASRGLCGIDGQISTFLGQCRPNQANWALIGDLTAIYDMAGPWFLGQMGETAVNLVIINNSGGQIFSRMYDHSAFLNTHRLNFAPLAAFWGWDYVQWTSVPTSLEPAKGGRIIEMVPNSEATNRFLAKAKQL